LVGETVAERRMYVPLAAVVPLLIVGGYALHQRVWRTVARRAGREPFQSGPAAVFSVATIALAIGFGCVSAHRLAAYRDEFLLWQDAVVHQPHDPVVRINLGIQFAEAGQFPEAIAHLEEAVRLPIDPAAWCAEMLRYRAHYNLARALEGSARPQDAIEQYRTTLRLRPGDAASHYNLARLLEDAGLVQEAAPHYRQAISARPDFSEARANLGILLIGAGHTREAIENFEAALRVKKDLANYVNLATAYSIANRAAEAIPMAEKGLDLARAQGETSMAEELEATLAHLRARRSRP
jgi:tetratricopeptide (TPR) repeat protein